MPVSLFETFIQEEKKVEMLVYKISEKGIFQK